MAPEYWEALEESETLALNGIGFCNDIISCICHKKNGRCFTFHWYKDFLSFRILSDVIAFLSLVGGVSFFPILGKNFSQSNLIVI